MGEASRPSHRVTLTTELSNQLNPDGRPNAGYEEPARPSTSVPSLNGFGDLEGWAGQEDSRRSSTADSVPPGGVNQQGSGVKHLGKMVALVLVLLGAIVFFAGRRGPETWPAFFKTITGSENVGTTLVDSHAGVVLMLETDGDSSRVLVSRSGDAGWILVSRDDTTATNPSLSLDGERVAYLTRRGGGQIAIVSLTDNWRESIGVNLIREAASNAGLGEAGLCPWTPVSWAPMSERIAFFGCGQDDAFSVAVVATFADPDVTLSIIGASRSDVSGARQIEWLDGTCLVVSTPSGDRDEPTVKTFDVP